VVTRHAVRAGGNKHLYPTETLAGCDSALILFAAGFHGAQDAIWIADAGLQATCVDLDVGKLAEMEDAYPADWEYVPGDVFVYATRVQRQWDIVSLDPPTQLFQEVADKLPLWCLLARRAVVIGHGMKTDVVPPLGWKVTELRRRSSFRGGVYWSVVEPVRS
jgi:hypothetical protein